MVRLGLATVAGVVFAALLAGSAVAGTGSHPVTENEVDVTFAAAHPDTYTNANATTTGGGWGNGIGGPPPPDVVSSLAPFDFACGDRVVFLTEIVGEGGVSDGTLAAGWEFDKHQNNGGESGHWTAVNVSTEENVGITVGGASIVTGAQDYTGVISVTLPLSSIDDGDRVVVRIVTTLVCGVIDGGSSISSRWDGPDCPGQEGLVEAVGPPQCQVGGTQTIPMKPGTLPVEELEVEVTKTADPSVKRGYQWHIKKWASHKQVVLARKKHPDAKKGYDNLSRFAKSAVVSYWVRVNAKPFDHSHRVSGEITVSVPQDADSAAVIDQVTDTVSNGISAPVTCDPALPQTLAPGKSLTCTYDVALPNGDARTNTATASAKLPDEQETEDFSSEEVPFNFNNPDVRGTTNTEANVYDSRVGFLGRVRASQTPRVFHYNLLVQPGGLAPLCGRGSLENTARVVSKSGEDSSSVTIPIEVRCFVSAGNGKKKSDTGKKNDTGSGSKDEKQVVNEKGKITGEPSAEAGTHADNVCVAGPNVKRGTKNDPAWAGIGPKAHKTKFFNAPRSYSKVMRAKAKNPYYRLGRPYVRAKLNMMAGAPVGPAAGRSLVWADRWLASHAPADVSKKQQVSRRTKRLIAKHSKMLKRYNKSARGYQPPTCNT